MKLQAFIHAVGAIVFLLGLGIIVVFLWELFGVATHHDRFLFGLIAVTLMFSTVGALVARIGWRMFRRWDREVVGEYAELQSLCTAIALGKMVAVAWPSVPAVVIGTVAFLLIRKPIRELLLRVLDMPAPHSRRAVEMAMRSETLGTPWQNNPAHCK